MRNVHVYGDGLGAGTEEGRVEEREAANARLNLTPCDSGFFHHSSPFDTDQEGERCITAEGRRGVEKRRGEERREEERGGEERSEERRGDERRGDERRGDERRGEER
jgi:hypothetical protein